MPKKNILELGGKPLIIHTLDAAREAASDKDICVSTDSADIIEVLEKFQYKVPFIRPEALATDTSSSEDVILHSIEFYKDKGIQYDYIVLLQPTSPLRTGEQISEAIGFINSETEMLMSVKETDSNPYYVLFEEDERGILQKSKSSNAARRQDLPKVYEADGAIYIIHIGKLQEKGMANLVKTKYVMDKKSSIDIDDEIDFQLCGVILDNKKSK